MAATVRTRATSRLNEDLRAPTKWPALDGVRGLAVICVVLYHALRMLVLGDGGFSELWWPAATGRFALDAFFVLSGFLIVESWTAVRRRASSLWGATREYGRRRLARILPAYWVSLLVLVPLVAPHLFRSPADLALLAGVQQYLRPGLPSEVNVVYWSLTTEMHFYALAPLVALAIRRIGAWRTVVACLGIAVWWQATTPWGLPKSLLLGRVDQFALGAALAQVVKHHAAGGTSWLVATVNRRGVGAGLIGLLGALGLWQGAVLDGRATELSALMHPAVGVVMAAMFLRMLTSGRRSLLENNWLRLAGFVSYGVYLFHYPLLKHGFEWAGLEPGANAPVVWALTMTLGLTIASFVAGVVSYVVVESPFLRKKGARVETPAPVPMPGPTVSAWPVAPAASRTYSASSGGA